MVDTDLVMAKLAELADRLDRVRRHASKPVAELATDRDATDLLSFNLMLAVQSCSDVASHLIADEGWPPAVTLAGAFARVHERGVVSVATAHALARAVGLRDIVAHGCAGIDVRLLHVATTTGVDDLERYAREVAAWVLRRV